MKELLELKFYLMKNGINQTKLSEATGLHKNTISKLLNTGEGAKSTKELVRLYLGLDKDHFSELLNG
jgi:DNA-binding Xre family transcriptional regulator